MICTPLPGGGFACSSGRRPSCCACRARRATQQCDWKIPGKKSGTCDRWLCTGCAYVPAPEKDLCPAHKAEWLARQGARA